MRPSGDKIENNADTTTAQTVSDDGSVSKDAPKVREKVDVDGRFSSSCDIMLPSDFINGSYYFVGAAKMRNTGNVGIVVEVKARWDQVASAKITDERTFRLDVGQRKTAKFRLEATQDEIDEHQNSPDYFGSGEACKVRPTSIPTASLRSSRPWRKSRHVQARQAGAGSPTILIAPSGRRSSA